MFNTIKLMYENRQLRKQVKLLELKLLKYEPAPKVIRRPKREAA